MDRSRHNTRTHCSSSTPSEESALDFERNFSGYPNMPSLSPPTLQPLASAEQHCESNVAYFSWLPETLGKLLEMNLSLMEGELINLEDGIKAGPSVEHQFIPSFLERSPLHQHNMSEKAVFENLASLRNGCGEDLCVSLQLGDNEAKRTNLFD